MKRLEVLSPPPRGDASVRELEAAREIAHAFLTSDTPAEVYRLALERVAGLVGAAFGCVYLRGRDDDSDVLRLVAAWNWPESHAPYLDSMTIRVGNGPTGRAVATGEVVELFDVFADPGLSDWWDAARELGFASSVSLPLECGGEPSGAITFYFQEPETLGPADRDLLRLVADTLAATAQKAHLIDDLQGANRRLREQNVELEARYREAEEARRLKNEFLANVSHELRTPLTAILGYAYLLREAQGALGQEQRGAVERIESAGGELLGLIDDLLDLTHLKLGRTQPQPERCDAAALARGAVAALEAAVPAPVELRCEIPDLPVPVHTDPAHALRILRKLVSNALKFTHTGSVAVRVRLCDAVPTRRGAGPGVAWEVEDTGIGIAPELLEAIFDEFRQVDGSATRAYGGAGIGLALARQLARRMGGEITVRSRMGEGSLFTLFLPAEPLPARVES